MAFSIDTGIIGTGRAQMRTITDAAALAGAMQLVATEQARENRFRETPVNATESAIIRSEARRVAGLNRVLGDEPIINDADVLIGFLEPTSSTATLSTSQSLAPFFNSVQVTAQRTANQGGRIPTPFGSILGANGAEATIRSTATVQAYTIAGFSDEANMNTSLLPIVLDEETYHAMIGGETEDRYSYDPATGNVTNGPDEVPESVIYGVKKKNMPGNWGTVKIGVNNNSTSTLSAQIRYGITPGQLANMGGSIRLDPVTKTLILPANPGLSAAIKSPLEDIKGRPVTIPIYRGSGGNGNNAWYEIVDFATVRIVKVELTGNNKHVIVQKAVIDDPTAIAGQRSSFKDGGVTKIFLSR